MVNDTTDVMKLDDVTAMLKMRRSAIYRMTAAREIPHYMVGRRLRFSRVAIQAWLAAQARPMRDVSATNAQDGVPTTSTDVQDVRESGRCGPGIGPAGASDVQSRAIHTPNGKSFSKVLRNDL